MAIRSGLLAGITTVLLVLVLGNERVIEEARGGGDLAFQTRTSVTGQLGFQVWDLPSEIRTATVVRLVLLVGLTVVLGAIAGRARPLAAFVGGWSAFLVAAVVSAGVYGLVVDDRFVARPGADTIDSFTVTASFGTAPGMWLGWLVGLAVLVGSLGQDRRSRPAPSPPPGPSWGAPAPPPPWEQQPAPPAAPSPPPAGPVIGAPPDRTQVYGQPDRNP